MAEAPPPVPTNGTTPGLSIPAPDFVAQGKAQATGAVQADFWGDLVRKYFIGHATGVQALVNAFVSIVDYLAADVVSLFGAFQGQGAPGFYDLIAVILGDLLGVEMSEQTIVDAFARKGSLAAFREIGKSYMNTIIGELQPQIPLTPAGGLASAQGWLGYILGFSVREGNIAVISDLLPELLDPLKGFTEYGESMRTALGLGRMSRQALHPIIQTLITDPLQWYVNQTYRPKVLGESLAVRAYNRGWIPREALDTEMQYAGYSDDRAAVLQADSVTYFSPNDAWELYKLSKVDISALTIALRLSGFDPNSNDNWIAARTAQDVKPYTDQLIQDWKGQWLNGYITLAQLEGFLDQLPMLPDVRNALYNALGQLGEYPRRKLTLAEVQSAFIEGIYILDDVQAFLKSEGYGDDAIEVLTLQTMLKLGTAEAKRAVASYAYDKAVAKAEKAGEPKPPPPAILVPGPTG